MRKTYLTVEYAFPFVKSRQQVIAFEETELTPIEVAIETIEARSSSLELIINAKPVNIKLLQLRLQVSFAQKGPSPHLLSREVLVSLSMKARQPLPMSSSSRRILISVRATAKFVPIVSFDCASSFLLKKLVAAFKRFLSVCKAAIDLNAREIQGDRVCLSYRSFLRLLHDYSSNIRRTWRGRSTTWRRPSMA
jgi:translation initiation factor 1 (eIF-1/SUI1)